MLFSTCSAPHRVSLFGGGSDLTETIDRGIKGRILSFSIKHRVTTIVKFHSKLFVEKFRLNYSKSELTSNLDDIKNNIARETLKFLKIKEPLYLATISDIPESCGLSSSSAFSVSILGSINALRGCPISWDQAAHEAFIIENRILKRRTGLQDSYAVSIGGINFWEFEKTNNSLNYSIKNSSLNKSDFLRDFIKNNISLIWLGQRKEGSSFIDVNQNEDPKSFQLACDLANKQSNLAQKAFDYINDSSFIEPKFIGDLMKESWEIKKSVSDFQVPEKVDKFIKILKESGAYGWKLSGSGGGGFILAIIDEDQRKWISEKFSISFFTPEVDYAGLITKVEY